MLSDTTQLKGLDLFAGAGGLSSGFEQAGFEMIKGIDSNEQFLETWKQNHSGQIRKQDLSTDISIPDIDVNLVIGGPPCKDFSNLNRTIDLGRNNLVLLFGKMVQKISPDVFVLENVRQLTTQYSDILDSFIEMLSGTYNLTIRTLDAADYGVPQHRIRSFVVGFNKSVTSSPYRFPKPTHGPDSPYDVPLVSSGEALSSISNPTNTEDLQPTTKHKDLLPDIPPGLNYSFYTEKLGHPDPQFEWRSKFSDYLYKADPEKPVRTITAKPGAASGPFHWNNRRFSVAELKQLQSFPESFTFTTNSRTKIHEMIGNSVPPQQAYMIALAIRDQIQNSSSKIPTLEEDEKLHFFSRRRTSSEEYQKKATNRYKELNLI